VRRTLQPVELQAAGEKEAEKDKDKDKEKPAAAQTAWKVFHTPEGRAYYHKSATNQTTWQRPPEMVRLLDRREGGEGALLDRLLDRREGGEGALLDRLLDRREGGEGALLDRLLDRRDLVRRRACRGRTGLCGAAVVSERGIMVP
jgi:hypothetical protein